MEVAIGTIRSNVTDSVLSIRAAGIRRQAPVRESQKFYFPSFDGKLAVDVLQKIGSIVLAAEESVAVESTNGDVSLDLHVAQIDGQRPPESRPETAERPDTSGTSASRHTTALRTKDYMDAHHIGAVVEQMVRE